MRKVLRPLVGRPVLGQSTQIVDILVVNAWMVKMLGPRLRDSALPLASLHIFLKSPSSFRASRLVQFIIYVFDAWRAKSGLLPPRKSSRVVNQMELHLALSSHLIIIIWSRAQQISSIPLTELILS